MTKYQIGTYGMDNRVAYPIRGVIHFPVIAHHMDSEALPELEMFLPQTEVAHAACMTCRRN